MKKTGLLGISLLLTACGTLLFTSPAFSTPTEASSPSEKRFQPPDGWQEQKKFDFGYYWLEKSERNSFISVLEDDRAKSAELEKSDAEFIAKIRHGKSLPQTLAGITAWEVTKLERTQLPQGQGTRVVLIGSYRNLHRKLVRFEEWQFFLKSGYGQIQYTEEDSAQPRSHEQIAQILERYHPFGT